MKNRFKLIIASAVLILTASPILINLWNQPKVRVIDPKDYIYEESEEYISSSPIGTTRIILNQDNEEMIVSELKNGETVTFASKYGGDKQDKHTVIKSSTSTILKDKESTAIKSDDKALVTISTSKGTSKSAILNETERTTAKTTSKTTQKKKTTKKTSYNEDEKALPNASETERKNSTKTENQTSITTTTTTKKTTTTTTETSRVTASQIPTTTTTSIRQKRMKGREVTEENSIIIPSE